MSTVIETLGKYETYLKNDRQNKPATLRKIRLSLAYFAELFGATETTDLMATDMHAFYHWLKLKKSRKSKKGVMKSFGSAHLNKILSHIKTYVKRLSNNAKLGSLVPADVPHCKVTEKTIAYLTKEEMALLMQHLEQDVINANVSGEKHAIYCAYLWRAVVRMLYTTGLRNFELRGLAYENLNISQLTGTIIGKGSKPGVITYSQTAAEKLNEYLAIRTSFFPDTNFSYIFTLYEKGEATAITEQKLNIAVKNIAKAASIEQNVYAHLFRHTLATHLLQDGRSIVDVKEKLRHSNISVTSIYLHSNPETVRNKTKSFGDELLSYGSGSVIDTESMLSIQHSIILWLLDKHLHTS